MPTLRWQRGSGCVVFTLFCLKRIEGIGVGCHLCPRVHAPSRRVPPPVGSRVSSAVPRFRM
eukprot:2716628-Prymnesium_polylepis.2